MGLVHPTTKGLVQPEMSVSQVPQVPQVPQLCEVSQLVQPVLLRVDLPLGLRTRPPVKARSRGDVLPPLYDHEAVFAHHPPPVGGQYGDTAQRQEPLPLIPRVEYLEETVEVEE